MKSGTIHVTEKYIRTEQLSEYEDLLCLLGYLLILLAIRAP